MKWKTMQEMEAETSASYYGTENHHFNPLYPAMKYTDGIQFVGANGFGWLIDDIGFNLHEKMAKDGKGFYCVVLDVQDTRAKITVCVDMEDENFIGVLAQKKIDYTDAPVGRMRLYWQDGVLLLPSEY
jgi:hypothetical protein